jgi:hypothetical protein
MAKLNKATATNAAPAMAKAATTAIAATTGNLPAVKTVTVQMVCLTGKVVAFKGNTARAAYYNWCQANIGKGMQLAQLVHVWGVQATNPSCIGGTAPKTGVHANMPEPSSGWLNFLMGRKKAQPIAVITVLPAQVPLAQVWAVPKV